MLKSVSIGNDSLGVDLMCFQLFLAICIGNTMGSLKVFDPGVAIHQGDILELRCFDMHKVHVWPPTRIATALRLS